MKILHIGSIFIVFSSMIIAAQTNDTMPTNIHIHFNPGNSAHIHANNNVSQEANHVSNPQVQVTTNVEHPHEQTNFSEKMHEFYESQSKNMHESSTNLMQSIWNNPLKSLFITVITCYSTITYKIYYANTIINDSHSWCNWQNSRSIEDLFATPQTKLESDLLFAIQTRYVHPVNPTDFIYSLVQSSISLHQEIKILDEQIARYQLLEKCRCLPLFFIEAQELVLLQEKHRKLAFIKYIFSSWCANYKIDKNI